jgi:hypothetical protein
MAHVALQRRSVKASGFVASREFSCKYPESRKNYLLKSVLGGQSLYMTTRCNDMNKTSGQGADDV